VQGPGYHDGTGPSHDPLGLDRASISRLLHLAVPAFLALVVEPLFLLVDAAVVGHLGTPELAGLGIAAVLLRAAVGLSIFLAYGTTASVARQVGAGDLRGALQQGVDGLWLALGLGVVGAMAGVVASPALVSLFATTPEVHDHAVTYLRVSCLGLPPMLLVLAATGVLRGLSDARSPLVAAVAGSLANIVLNVVLVYPVGLGLPGSAIGTVLAQTGMATYLVLVVVRHARAQPGAAGEAAPGPSLRPHLPGVRRSARAGGPLVVRTLTLQAVLLVTTWSAARQGATATATHQLAMTVWTFLAYALDAVAIAAQTLTGEALGAGDRAGVRALTTRMIRIGLVSGLLTGVLLALTAPLLGPLFTSDEAVVDLLGHVLLAAALFQPLAGIVFVLDGVLIGAGDGRYLARAGTFVLLLAAPAVLAAAHWGRDGGLLGGLVAVWLAFGVTFIGGRAVLLLRRARSDDWMVLGAHPRA
jgi:putative MATE family efflux protein